MAKQSQSSTPVTPDFKDVDKESAARAQAALAGGKQEPLKVPKGAAVSSDKKGIQYTRWAERIQITQAYRSVTPKGLMDVAITAKIRQSDKNNGSRVFGHFYLNLGENISEGHEFMNDKSYGALISLLTATGFMPAGGSLKGSLLAKMFPSKNQPGVSSPLNGKAVTANVVQTYGPQKDLKTGKPMVDEDGDPIMERRDSLESFLPDVADSKPTKSTKAPVAADEDEDAEEDEE